MKIVFVISSLTSGGAERVAVLLAQGLSNKGHQIVILTIYKDNDDFYKLPNIVQRIALNIGKNSPTLIHAFWNNINRLSILRNAICFQRPDLIISFMDVPNVMTLLALTNTKYPLFITEHNNPYHNSKGIIWDALRYLTYRMATKLVSTSQGVDECFNWISKPKRAVIYNPLVPIKDINSSQNKLPIIEGASNKKWIVSMGRLTYQKGFDILLKAFQKFAKKYLNWQLVILGEGELRSELENLREHLDLTHQVIFPGLISNPFPILKKSHLFVLSSRYEGFGNVLIEAMACGLPVISTDCPSGPREIICDGVNGLLVTSEDPSALAEAMENLMSDEKARESLAKKALEGVAKFQLDKIVENWEILIDEAIKAG